MVSIWFFVALVVAFVAVYLLGHRIAAPICKAKSEDMPENHDFNKVS